MSATTNNFLFAKKEYPEKARNGLYNVWLLSLEPGLGPCRPLAKVQQSFSPESAKMVSWPRKLKFTVLCSDTQEYLDGARCGRECTCRDLLSATAEQHCHVRKVSRRPTDGPTTVLMAAPDKVVHPAHSGRCAITEPARYINRAVLHRARVSQQLPWISFRLRPRNLRSENFITHQTIHHVLFFL
jgi:hypothetical protein